MTFELFDGPDGTGARVGTAINNVFGPESGQRWRFEAVGTSDDATSFDTEETTAYRALSCTPASDSRTPCT